MRTGVRDEKWSLYIPGAISLPVLTDAQRAEVGTIYVQDSRFRARKIGAAHVARNAAAHIEGPLAGRGGAWRPLIYCWRGGQRSGSFASILAQIGWRVGVVEGGYRSYRRLVVAAMREASLPHRLVVIDGNTGTAKTALLERLAARGAQVVDLEAMAVHRGSVFGPAADRPQPSQKAFEGALAVSFARLDPTRPVIVEAESSKIGECLLPPAVWAAMRAAPRIEITAPPEARAAYLTRAYGDLTEDPTRLIETLDRLRRLQGHERVSAWQGMAAAGQFEPLALALITDHYDPRYRRSRARHSARIASSLSAERLDEASLDGLAAQCEAEIARLA